jgi:hypothetical protein
MMVTSRKMTARPGISIGRSGRSNFATKATIAGSAKAHAIHIAASRAKEATASSFIGNDLVAGS